MPYTNEHGSYHPQVDTIQEAKGLFFLCPVCYARNEGRVGTHWDPVLVPRGLAGLELPLRAGGGYSGPAFRMSVYVAGSSSVLHSRVRARRIFSSPMGGSLTGDWKVWSND